MRIIVQIELHEPGHPGQLKRLPVCFQKNFLRLPAGPSDAGTTSAIELEPPWRFLPAVIHWPKATRKNLPASLPVAQAPFESPDISEQQRGPGAQRAVAIPEH